jgi:LysR family cyn operon transcriptional activator
MNLKHLRYFIAVVEEGGVRKAALRIFISQPALTLAIKNLEADLNTTLFFREKKRVRPTPSGLQLYKHAKQIVGYAQRIKKEIQQDSTASLQTLRIAAPALICAAMLSEPMSQFLAEHPHVRIQLSQASAKDVQRQLLNNDVDLGFLVSPPDNTELQTRLLGLFTPMAFVSSKHPLASRKQLEFSELVGQPLVTLPKHYQINEYLLEGAKIVAQELDIILETDALWTLTKLVEKQQAIGILTSGVQQTLHNLVGIPISSIPNTKHTNFKFQLIGAYPLNAGERNIEAAFLETLEQSLQS